MTRVTLIQCTKSKRDEPATAEDLYDESGYFEDMKGWARAKRQPWFILSAKHGLLSPPQVVEPYDDRGLTVELSQEIAGDLAGMGVSCVDVTAGMDYTDPLVPELETRGIDVVNHFAGEGIGLRRKHLQEETEKLRHGGL